MRERRKAMRSAPAAAGILAGVIFAAVWLTPDVAQAQHQPLIRLGSCDGYQPVCAVKQKTLVSYVNVCAARGVNARVVSPDRACIEGCPRQYAPVCATASGQRRVFGNSCEAEKSGAVDIRKGTCRRFFRRN
jgi:hypothetical protein